MNKEHPSSIKANSSDQTNKFRRGIPMWKKQAENYDTQVELENVIYDVQQKIIGRPIW